jgi:hypothetical protein
MSEKPEVEIEITEESEQSRDRLSAASKKTGEGVGHVLGGIVDTLEAALSGRGNTVMVRVHDDALSKLDMLIAAGICKSRSESAAFLLQRGIESSAAMFERIGDVTAEITGMRQELLDWVQNEGK